MCIGVLPNNMFINGVGKMLLKNRYRILKHLGGGGFADTFLVEDIISNQNYAMKQLRNMTNDLSTYKIVEERFHREAAVLAKLNDIAHSVPNLYDFFSENGKWYLVQEWVDGEDLLEKVSRDGPLGEIFVINIMVELLFTLKYIHSKGVIHRDIKPNNIMIRHQDRKLVLIDFGAVKELVNTMLNPNKNPISIVIGTPGFMSPEQSVGTPVVSSDLYSLGITAIYLLTGETISNIVDTKTNNVNQYLFIDKIDPKLFRIIDKIIKADPSERYPTAQSVLDDICKLIVPTPAHISDDKGNLLAKLHLKTTTIGRENCDVCFENDKTVSGHHCYILNNNGQFVLVDNNSRNGVFKKIDKQTLLNSGDVIVIGKQMTKITFLSNRMVEMYIMRDNTIYKTYTFNLTSDLQKITIGRENCDVCFENDKMVSGHHCYILNNNGQFVLVDNNSRNGVFKKIDKQTLLNSGDVIVIGKQLLFFNNG